MSSLFRAAIDRMAGYLPGEQPQDGGWIKLNTNENPYPPSPRVVDAIRRAAEGRLNVYPDPHATEFRKVAAKLFNVDPDWILPANGSDENLTIITRTFCDADESIAYPYPSYVLYESLAQIQGSKVLRLKLDSNWQWDTAATAKLKQQVRTVIGPVATPDEIRFTESLPTTRSGKIMRRLLKQIAAGDVVTGDTTTLEDLSILAKLASSDE